MENVTSLNKIARIAGVGYLIIFISGIFANFFVLENLVKPDDAAATFSNIMERQGQFRIGIMSFMIMVIFDVLLTWALYILFKPVNKNLSLLSAWLRLVNCVIFGIALFNLFNVLGMTSGESYLSAFETGQIHANVMLNLDTFNYTWLIGLVFFGLHLSVIGYLIIKSDYIPSVIGILLIIASVGYLTDSFAQFLMPDYGRYAAVFSMIVVIPGVTGELALTLWLLIKGVKINTDKIIH